MKQSRIKKPLRFCIPLCALLVLGACSDSATNSTTGNGTGLDNNNGSDNGEVIIGLTDAAGDFASYRVDVLSLSLTRADGLVVETLPETTSFDFSEYVDLTEFLTAASVPAGVYTAGSLQLDYSSADILVENDLGDLVQATTIVNENGDPLEQIEVSVNLEERQRLIVAPGNLSNLTVDFDLQASNSVSFDVLGNATVTVSPVLIAELERDGAKPHRARGALVSVDTAASEFTLALRPYRQRLSSNQRFGELAIVTDQDTRFAIDGESANGDTGLNLLAQKDPRTVVIARGNYRRNPVRFVASDVVAGSSLPGDDVDAVVGVVLAREANQLRMGGATISKRDGQLIVGEAVTVILDDATRVSVVGEDTVIHSDAISVGQRITAWGELAENNRGDLQLSTIDGS